MTTDDILHALKKKAIGYLSVHDCSERQLKAKLLNLKKWYPNNTLYPEYTGARVDRVVSELVAERILDERRALRNMLESGKTGGYGINRIKLRMIRNKYKKEYISEVLGEYQDYGATQDLAKIIRLARTKKAGWEKKFTGDRKKLASIHGRLRMFLAQKGFTADDSARIMKEI